MGNGWYSMDDVLGTLMVINKGHCHYTAFSLLYLIMANEKGRIQVAVVFDEHIVDVKANTPGDNTANRGWSYFNTDGCTLYIRVVHGGSGGRSAEYCGATLLTKENFDNESDKFFESFGEV